MTVSKQGLSAQNLQRVTDLGSYQTAWTMLHKLRTVMTSSGRSPLSGRIEMDETYIGGSGKPGSTDGTYQGSAQPEHLQAYLDEFVFCFNRRRSRKRGMLFFRPLEAVVAGSPAPYKDIAAIHRKPLIAPDTTTGPPCVAPASGSRPRAIAHICAARRPACGHRETTH